MKPLPVFIKLNPYQTEREHSRNIPDRDNCRLPIKLLKEICSENIIKLLDAAETKRKKQRWQL